LEQAKKEHQGKNYTVRDGGITCHLCGMTSYNRDDIQQHYCGNCHLFLDKLTRQDAAQHHKPHITMWVPRARHGSAWWYWVAIGLCVLGVACLIAWCCK